MTPPGTPAKAALPRNNKSITPKSAASSAVERSRKVGAFAVQCADCLKFRFISTQEEFEEIRRNFIEQPWLCGRKENVSCDDPADLVFESNALWAIDKPNLPKTPAGCQRILVMRKDFSKMDATYVMPNGKRMRSTGDVEKFLEAFPEYKDQFSVSDFSFTVPKVMEGTLPGKSGEKGSVSTGKRMRNEDTED